MQNTTGKVLEEIVARRLSCQLENDKLLPATLGSYRVGKGTWVNTAVLAFDVYDAKREEPLVIALGLEDAYNLVDCKILIRTLNNMKFDPYIILWIGKSLLKSGTKSGTMDF